MLERLENLSALYANPHRFMNLAARLHAPLWLTAVGALAFGLFMVSAWLPNDYQQGATVRIMFVCARRRGWRFAHSFIFFASIVAVVLRHPLGYLAARAAAPVGAVFTLVALVTGALWGQPVGYVVGVGCTPHLCLGVVFIYLGYIALWEAIDDYGCAARHINFGSCGFCQCADCKIFRRLVEHIAPTGQRVAFCAACLACRFSLSALVMGVAFLLLFLAITLTPANGSSAPTLACAPGSWAKLGRRPVIRNWVMYDFYIYASYIFTAFALGAIIAVSFAVWLTRQRLATLQDTQMAMAEKQSTLRRWLPMLAAFGFFGLFMWPCLPVTRRGCLPP